MNIKAVIGGRFLALTAGLAIVLGGMFAVSPAFADSAPPDPANPMTPPTVTDDVLPTPQIDGVVWAQTVVGNVDYVVGDFANARPYGSAPGVNTVPRDNILAYNVTTGALLNEFDADVNAQVSAIAASPDGSTIYIGGDFTAIDGVSYYRLAAFSTATGDVIPSFKPVMGSSVKSLAATNSTVYAGGWFKSINGATRDYLGAVNAQTGATLPFVANADYNVNALALTTDGTRLIVGGQFQNLSGNSSLGLGAVDPTTGNYIPWAASDIVQDYGVNASIDTLYATPTAVFGAGYVWTQNPPSTAGNLEGTFEANPDTGQITGLEDCHGDTYSVFATSSLMYEVGHQHYCGNIGGFPQTNPWTFHHLQAFSTASDSLVQPNSEGAYYNWAGYPAMSLQDFYPNFVNGTFTGQDQATWSVAGNADYIVAGGEFPSVNGISQQGLTRFAISSLAPNKVGPQGIPLVPNAVSFTPGQVTVSWNATYDNDNGYLTYNVYRDNGTTPIYTTTEHSNFYTTPPMGFTDTGLTPGSTHTYKVVVTDPFGNSTNRSTPAVTVATTNTEGNYGTAVAANGASQYWPLDETSGAVGFDHIGYENLSLGTGITRTTSGPISPNGSAVFNGTSSSVAVTPEAIAGPNTFTVQAWINTTSTTGGKIIGFGDTQSGDSSNYDRQVYMDNSGQLVFGVYNGGTATIVTPGSYNDGNWHFVSASLGPNGMQLYVDGVLVGQSTQTTIGQAYSGYWKIGGDNLNGWPDQPSNEYFTGDIGQVAIFPTVLTRTQVSNEAVAAGLPSTVPSAPSDAYGAAVFNQNPELYWRLNEPAGAGTAIDSGPNAGGPLQENGIISGPVTTGVPGALSGVPSNTAASFSGGTVVSQVQDNDPTTYSLELWFNTTTTNGGKLIGFGNAQSGLSSNYDRHVYMQNNGQLVFGTWTGSENTITSPLSYNDGQWHYMVATQGPDGMSLYVDGNLVGTNPQTSAQAYSGYWRIGGDNTWGSNSPYFTGSLDEVAVYDSELTPAEIAQHYQLGAGTAAAPAPVASFTQTNNALTASFDGTGSSVASGTITGYSWNFGDGGTSTSSTPTHTYGSAGTYAVSLTVTDSNGDVNTVTKNVTVSAANIPPVAQFTSTVSSLTASFDGSTSYDPDGTVAQYAWNFGDGTTGTGETASHAYTAAGTYPVTLTVTDNDGATDSVTNNVTVTAPPVAAFTSGTSALTASFDGSSSTDASGTIQSYAWNFGDGTTATGVTTSHTYSSAGTYAVTLTVTDSNNATSSITQNVTVAAPLPPAASFTASTSGLTVAVNGSGSTDPDGTIAQYAWNFGDGSTGTGATTSHTYTSAGTYTVSLTVTDNLGATNTTTQQVTVATAVSGAIAQDSFQRTTTSGWGTANVGGAWTVSGGATHFSTSGGVGIQSTPAGSTLTASLGSVSSTSTDVLSTVTTDKVPTGAGIYLTVIGRLVGSSDYDGRLWISPSGQVQLQLLGNGTTLKTYTLPGVTYTAGEQFNLRVEAVGTSPTTLRARAWQTGTTEPTSWQLTTTDSTAALQAAGSVGLRTYLSSSNTNAPLQAEFSNFVVVNPSTGTAQPPVAAFTSTTNGLAASFNAGTSTDPNGGITSYAWNFGDGSTGTGATPSHTYGAAGTYTVSLTVTDAANLTNTTTQSVTVTAPAVNQPPVAAFQATPTGLTVAVNGSASTDPDGSVASWAWNFGDGSTGTGATASHTYAAAGTYTITLTVTDNQGATNATSQQVTVSSLVANAIAQDEFQRTTTGGWGTADLGGAWTVSGGAANFSTAAGVGSQSGNLGATLTASLASVKSTSSDVSTTVTTDKVPVGGGVYISAIGRLVGSSDYEGRLWISPSGTVQLQLLNSGTTVSTYTLPGVTYTQGMQLNLRVQVFGTSPTTLRAMAWVNGTTEPTAWQLTTTDSTAALQVAGSVGLRSYVSSLATNTPITTKFSNFVVVPAQ
jgi:PKD repeat protein